MFTLHALSGGSAPPQPAPGRGTNRQTTESSEDGAWARADVAEPASAAAARRRVDERAPGGRQSGDGQSRPAATLVPPSCQALRDEVARNPHAAPMSYVRFSLQAGERMTEARRDPARARAMLEEFRGILMGRDEHQAAANVAAVCLLNARELSETHRELEPSYRELYACTPESVRRLMEP